MTRDNSAENEAVTGRLLILEYEQVKEEQRARIGFRDNLLYATLAAMAAIITFSLQSHGRPELLLLLPRRRRCWAGHIWSTTRRYRPSDGMSGRIWDPG
ncbi:hypothetical protein SVIO_094040 [Streptomyces violaceusniger]|uniref:SMODS and SLOG-associating 2TM effector domain-containing protein n=1 Tax=Streptomyces violaceusniger TaxID=68280 RepID=A0A4D4LB50_STRVO|nr:hypothetical protein SVIO_094040 [Streptomyces violaceusniger]